MTRGMSNFLGTSPNNLEEHNMLQDLFKQKLLQKASEGRLGFDSEKDLQFKSKNPSMKTGTTNEEPDF